MNREIRFNAWLPELQYMLEDVAVGHGSISFPFISEPEDEFYQFLKAKVLITDDDCTDLPDYLYDTGEDWCCISEQKHFVLLQFTGFTDKNGDDIFEGHILQSESKNNIVEVQFGVRKAKIKGYPASIDDSFEMHGWIVKNVKNGLIGELDISFYKGEVIGNIYENPELLKNENTTM